MWARKYMRAKMHVPEKQVDQKICGSFGELIYTNQSSCKMGCNAAIDLSLSF